MIRRYRVSLQSARQPVHLRRRRDMLALRMAVVPVRWCVWLACVQQKVGILEQSAILAISLCLECQISLYFKTLDEMA